MSNDANHRSDHFRRPAGPGRRQRSGLTIIIVLGLLALALAVSYTMVRTQITTRQIQGNLSRRDDARQAALTGMNLALRRMHDVDWPGVDVPLSASLGSDQWYEVSFTTGDTSLQVSDPDYVEYPYRVTITSVGYAADPSNPSVRSVHRVRAVVQFVRRALSEEPTVWNDLQQYTVHQWADKDVIVQIPVRIDGPLLLQGKIRLSDQYPNNSNAHQRYLVDLTQMPEDDPEIDFHPLPGPIDMPLNRTPASTRKLLQTDLGVVLNDVAGTNAAPLSHPGSVQQYRLYPGGKLYEVPTLQSEYGSNLTNFKLVADPIANPLGVYYSNGALNLYDNVTLQGTIITAGAGSTIHVYGDNVRLSAANVPPLEDATGLLELPAVITQNHFYVHAQASGWLNGLAMVGKKFDVTQGSVDVAFNLNGRLLTKELHVHGRPAWDIGDDAWVDLVDKFLDQLNDEEIFEPVEYFPEWVQQQRGLVAEPLLTIGPRTDDVTYHWQDWDDPIFVPHPDDGGLRWDLIGWTDNP